MEVSGEAEGWKRRPPTTPLQASTRWLVALFLYGLSQKQGCHASTLCTHELLTLSRDPKRRCYNNNNNLEYTLHVVVVTAACIDNRYYLNRYCRAALEQPCQRIYRRANKRTSQGNLKKRGVLGGGRGRITRSTHSVSSTHAIS